MPQIVVLIVNKKGLHARAAAKFVKIVAAHDAQVTVVKCGQPGEADSPDVDGASILGLMMLGADAGSQLRIDAKGRQADAVAQALETLITGRFGEPD